MTKEEAIKVLKAEITEPGENIYCETFNEAIYMAIEALSAEPTDLISRADAMEKLDDFCKWCKDGRLQGTEFVLDCFLPNLPSADRPSVAYICNGTACDGECDECHHTTDIEHAKNFKCVDGKYIETDGGANE